MKKLILSVAMLSLGTGAMAQGMYASFNLGYGFGTPGDMVGTVDVVDGGGNTTSTPTYGTLGGGFNIGLTPGYMISENFGIELGLNYLLGSTLTSTDFTTPATSTTIKTKSNQFRVSPTLVISTGAGEGLSAYAKAGIVLPVAGSTTTNVEATFFGGTSSQEISSKGAFSAGFTGAIGVNFGLSDKLSIFGELSHVSLRIKGKTQTIESSEVNGVNQLVGATTYMLETSYVGELNSSSNNSSYNPNPVNQGAAKEELAGNSNFNALFINLGVKFNF